MLEWTSQKLYVSCPNLMKATFRKLWARKHEFKSASHISYMISFMGSNSIEDAIKFIIKSIIIFKKYYLKLWHLSSDNRGFNHSFCFWCHFLELFLGLQSRNWSSLICNVMTFKKFGLRVSHYCWQCFDVMWDEDKRKKQP